MANRLKKAWRALKGAGTEMFQFGESNLVDTPGKTSAAPVPGTIVKAQVAERWMNQVTRGLTPEAIDDYLTTAISGDTLNQFALFEEMEEHSPELRLATYKPKLK